MQNEFRSGFKNGFRYEFRKTIKMSNAITLAVQLLCVRLKNAEPPAKLSQKVKFELQTLRNRRFNEKFDHHHSLRRNNPVN